MKKAAIATAAIFAAAITAASPSHAGILDLLVGSMDATQTECQAQNPGSFVGTWRCIRAHVAQGHTGDMSNGAAAKYMATGDLLFAKVQARKMDDATALYYLANALSAGDVEYEATHPDTSVTCTSVGNFTNCY